ncbi:MAG: DUF3466 family protein [Phycisphaerae bacterium]
MRNFLKITVFLAVASVVLSPAPAAGDGTYRLVIIEPWNTSYSLAVSSVDGLNNLNQVTGCATPLSGGCSFLWTLETGKVPINVAGPINDLGVITAAGYIRWPDGTLQEMDGAMAAGADLNYANVVVGADGPLHTCEYPPYFPNREAVVWSPEGGTILVQQQLGVWAADQAWAINNNNQFVGVVSSTGMCGDQKAFYYDLNTGEHIDLHRLVTGSASGITHAVDINDAGRVVGDGPVTMGGSAFLWSSSAGRTILPDLPGTLPGYSIPSSINNAGRVVGQAIVNEEWRAWIWDQAGGIRDLNEFVRDLPTNFRIVEAKKINDNGWIIGRGQYGAWSPERAVVLIPITGAVADLNCDGAVNTFDIDPFVMALADPAGYESHYPNCDRALADVNRDGRVNAFDIDPFVACLVGSCP